MKRISYISGVLLALLSSFPFNRAHATETDGALELGMWYLQTDAASKTGVLVDDGVGQNYLEKRYSLALFGLKLNAKDFWVDGSRKWNAHVRGKFYANVANNAYTLGISNRTRQQLDELNLEGVNVFEHFDLWLGRQTVIEAGNVLFDGVRGLYHVNDVVDIAFYGGLGADPRQLAGYIGPSYRTNPFSLNFETFGFYSSVRADQFKLDAALRTEFSKSSVDRVSFFSEASYQINPVWSLSAMTEYDLAGITGLRNGSIFVITRPVPTVTNTLSFSRWRALEYKNSNLSQIPVAPGIDPAPVGNSTVNRSSYNTVRDHVQLKLFGRNYIFGAVQFSRRTFDDKNQYKYTAGYRDPKIFGSSADLKFQMDVISNYRGFNTSFDTLLGNDFLDGTLRLEGGGTVYTNERQSFLSFTPNPTQPAQTEKEYSLRANLLYNPSRAVSWALQYAYIIETDALNLNEKIHTHDAYLTTTLRF